MVTKEEYLHVHVCMILYTWRPAGSQMTTVSQGILLQILWIVVFGRERHQTKDSVSLDVEAPQKCQCPAACASQWSQSSPSAMTHMRW